MERNYEAEQMQLIITQHQATIATLTRELQEARAERDEQGQLKADLNKRLSNLEPAYIKLERQRNDLEKWRDTVTLALQRPGGALFADVPQHIRGVVADLTTVRALVGALPVLPVTCLDGRWYVRVNGYFADVSEAHGMALHALEQYRATQEPAQAGGGEHDR